MDRTPSRRDLVYCHECENEWYRDEHGLECPSCASDFTEIIEAGHDPRDDDEPPELELRPYDVDMTPDPDETDISDWRGNPATADPFTYIGSGEDRHRHAQDALQPQMGPLFQGLASVVGNILGVRPGADMPQRDTARHQPGDSEQYRTSTPGRPFDSPQETSGRSNSAPGTPTAPNVTIRSGETAGFRWQITTSHGPLHYHSTTTRHPPGTETGSSFNDFFDEDFDSVRRFGMPPIYGAHGIQGLHGTHGMAFGGPQRMHQLHGDHLATMGPLAPLFASMLNPGMMRGGDAVFSQEALDRVITQLMEQNASGNAPGPATDEAIASLPKRTINEKDLGHEGVAECSICMEEVNIGQQVTDLPCHHWFHGECIKAWLTEHDTCPHCRQGIMPKEGQGTPTRVRNSNEMPRHDQMWGQGEGTQDNPWVVPESPQQERSSGRRRHSSTPRGSISRNSGSESLFSRMRNAFGGGSGGSGSS